MVLLIVRYSHNNGHQTGHSKINMAASVSCVTEKQSLPECLFVTYTLQKWKLIYSKVPKIFSLFDYFKALNIKRIISW
jgi:hypothetical protein